MDHDMSLYAPVLGLCDTRSVFLRGESEDDVLAEFDTDTAYLIGRRLIICQ